MLIYELPVKNLTPPFASATPISCNRGITLLLEYIFAMFWRFHRVQRPWFLIKWLKLWRFDNTVSECWAYFHRACAETAILELSVKNLSPPFAPATSISYKTDALPLPSDVYWIYSMFSCYYVAWPYDLDLWPFDLESVSCTVLLMSDPHTNFYYPTTIGYWVTSTEYLITFPLSETVTAHALCHVTSNQGQKYVHIFEIPDPNLPIHFVTFTALRRRLSHVIGKK